MPQNFGLLAPLQQQAQPLNGSAPSVPALRPQADGLNEFTNGFLNAYSQGQQIQSNDQALKIGDQTLQQQTMKTDEMRTQASEAQQLREAAQKGVQGLVQYYDQHDPVGGAVFKKTLADQQLAEANAKKADSEQYNASLGSRGQFYGIVNTGRDDKEKAQIWAIQRDSMPDSLKKIVPEQYSPQNLQAGMSILTFAMADYKAKHPESTASNSPTGKYQDDINNKEKDIVNKKAQGIDTTKDEGQLDQLKQGAVKTVTPTNLVSTPEQQITTATTTKTLTEGQTEAETSRKNLTNLLTMKSLDKGDVASGTFANASIGAKKGVAAMGQLFGINIDPKTAPSEAFNALATNVQLNLQTLLKGSTSDKDLETVKKGAPQISNTKEGRQLMYSIGIMKEASTIQRQEFRQQWAQQHKGSLIGADDAWDTFINSDTRLDPKTGDVNVSKYGSKYFKPFLNEEYAQKAQDKQASSATPAGSYTLNGKPFDMEAAKKATGLSEEEIKKQAGLK